MSISDEFGRPVGPHALKGALTPSPMGEPFKKIWFQVRVTQGGKMDEMGRELKYPEK